MGVAIQTRRINIVPQVHRAMAPAVKREPRDTHKLVEDMRKDPTFQLGIKVLRSMTSSAVVSFEVEGSDPRAESLSANLNDVWDQHVRQALDSIEYGRQAFEIIHGVNGDINTVRDLIPIPFELSELKIDKETGHRSCLKVGKGDKAVELTPQEYWWVTIDATEIEPFGKSRYRGAPYQVRQQRKKLDQQENTWYDRYSMGTGVARAPEEALGPPISGDGDKGEIDNQGNPVNPAEALAKSLDEIRAGGWMILSSGKYPTEQGGGDKWDLTQFPEVKDGTSMQSRRNSLDVAALRSLGIPERALIQEGQTGSYNLAEAHQLVLVDTVEDILRQVVTAFQEQIINRMVRLNELSARITMTWRPLNDKSEQQTDDVILAALKGTPSPLITERVIDFIKLLESRGWALGPDAEASLSRVAKASAAPAPSFGFGGASFSNQMACEIMKLREAKLFELSQISGGCCS